MGTALLEIRIIALLSTALLEVRIITLLVRVAEALLAVILLLSIALLLAAGLLVTAGLITAIACAVLLLISFGKVCCLLKKSLEKVIDL